MNAGLVYPENWDIRISDVLLQVEESVHYKVALPESRKEWRHLEDTRSKSSVRLNGSTHQAAIVSLFHQVHCVKEFRSLFLRRKQDSKPDLIAHINHCANYLRQWALCDADLTLEPGDFTERDFESDRIGQVHECRNWNEVYTRIDVNWEAWVHTWSQIQSGGPVARVKLLNDYLWDFLLIK